MQYLPISGPSRTSQCGNELQIPCEVVRSNRKTLALQMAADGRLIFRLPRFMTEQEAFSFAKKHEAWILQSYRKAVESQKDKPVYSAEEIGTYIEKLGPVLKHRVDYYAALLGVDYHRITIRDQKTRWGSCSSLGNLNFNWRLSLLPAELLDYVVVHELAHRLEMNHSRRFWAHVARILPDYQERRKRLKEYHI